MNKKNWVIIGIGAVVAGLAAVFFFRRRKEADHEKPPKNAPQLPIENPGEQSEFISAPSDSEIG